VAAAAPTIGTMTSNGQFQMNGADIWNQGALFDGTTIQTGKSASRLLLRNGTDLRIGAASSGRVFADHMVLQSGAVEGVLSNAFRLETGELGLHIQGENARAHIQINNGGVLIASLEGAVKIRGAQGLLLASLAEGKAVQLSPSAQSANVGTQLTGIIQHKNYRYYLTDEATGVTVEVKGDLVAKHAGKCVTVTGDVDTSATTIEKAEYAVRVTSLEVQSACKAPGGAALISKTKTGTDSAAKDKTVATSTGSSLGTATKVGIIAGIAVAGATTTGLVIAGNEETPAKVSP